MGQGRRRHNPVSRSPTLTDDQALAAIEQAADSLFYERGIVSVSMAEIRDRSGVSLRRLYGLCPAKADLVSVWLRHRHRVWFDGYTTAVAERLTAGATPDAAIFDALAEWMIETEFRGCGFINTHAEFSELTDTHRQLIRDHKTAVGQFLSTVTPDGDAIAVLVDGAIVQASIFCSVEPIRQAKRLAAAIEQHRETSGQTTGAPDN